MVAQATIVSSATIVTPATHATKIFKSPLGDLIGTASNIGLQSLYFRDAPINDSNVKNDHNVNGFEGSHVNSNKISSPENLRAKAIFERTEAWLSHYFNQTFDKLSPPPLDLQGSHFAIAVWRALLHIPYGKTESYGNIALAIQNPKGVRAVGTAIGNNPIALIIPCHRVIRSNGAIGGYRGGLDRKRWCLKLESEGMSTKLVYT